MTRLNWLRDAGNRGAAVLSRSFWFFFQAEDGIRDHCVTGVQTCALPIQAEDGIRELCDWSSDVCSSDRKSTRLNSSHTVISYAVFCLKKKKIGSLNMASHSFVCGQGGSGSARSVVIGATVTARCAKSGI